MTDPKDVRALLAEWESARDDHVKTITALSAAFVDGGGFTYNQGKGSELQDHLRQLAIEQACVTAFRECLSRLTSPTNLREIPAAGSVAALTSA